MIGEKITLGPPPMWEHLLLENPWPIVLALAGVALVLLIVAQRRLQRRPAVVALCCLLAAAGVYALAALVTTDREHITRRTAELVASTAPLDLEHFRSLFTADAELRGPRHDTWFNVEQLTGELQAALLRRTIRSHRIRAIEAQSQDASLARSLLRLNTTVSWNDSQQDLPTTWLFTWQRGNDGQWRVRVAQWLTLSGQEPALGVWR